MRIRITDIWEMSWHYDNKENLIGKCADVNPKLPQREDGFFYGNIKFLSPKLKNVDHIHGFKFERVYKGRS